MRKSEDEGGLVCCAAVTVLYIASVVGSRDQLLGFGGIFSVV